MRYRRGPALLLIGCLLSGCTVLRGAKLTLWGGSRTLRERPDGAAPNSPDWPGLLILALDGIDRPLLYDMLRDGELPMMGRLLNAEDMRQFPRAYFADSLLSTLPSSTLAAWVTALTGVTPAVHGVSGNEFFIRDRRRLAAPAPVSFDDPAPVVATYTDDYVNNLVTVPTVYERMRDRDADILIWVAMHQLHRGADRLLLTRRRVMYDAFEAYAQAEVEKTLTQEESRTVYEALDEEVIDDVVEALEDGPGPDVITVYVAGSDLFAHVANDGPDVARRTYLREVVDPLLGRLHRALTERDALSNRYVVVTADHGHTAVEHDTRHALGAGADPPPAAVARSAGFRLRPFTLETAREDFDVVLTLGGAFAYLYAADRSTCPQPGDRCDWSRQPRFREDVVPLADHFYRNNLRGGDAPAMQGALDMILTRRPQPPGADDLPFEVYVGDGQLMPLATYLKAHPHPDYVDMDRRLRDLAAGPLGERAGDVILLAHSGDRARKQDRYYFAAPYHSWHGSPSRQDSEIPFIVAHPNRSREEIGRLVRAALGDGRRQERIADVLLALRFDRSRRGTNQR